MKNTTETFPGFDYPAEQLSKFIAAGDTFTMLLKDGSIVHHTTKHIIVTSIFKGLKLCG